MINHSIGSSLEQLSKHDLDQFIDVNLMSFTKLLLDIKSEIENYPKR